MPSFPLFEIALGSAGNGSSCAFGFGAHVPALVRALKYRKLGAKVGPQPHLECEAHQDESAKNTELDLHALHEREMANLERERVLCAEQGIEAKIANVKLL